MKEQEKKIKKLEAKLEALTRYLKVEVCAEEEDGDFWCVVKKWDNKHFRIRRFF